MSLLRVAEEVVQERQHKLAQEAYLHDPVLWAREYLGIELWKKQREFLESIRDNRNTAVAAGHGVGKTYGAAIACAWWVYVHPPEETFIASTAPSVDQVAILWDNIRNLHALAKRRYEAGLVDRPLPGYVTGDNKYKLENGVLIGQGRKPPDTDSDVAFQGRHATYLFAIGDEAVGLNPGFLGALSNIATAPTNRQLLLANPTDPNSAMAKLWDPKITTWNRMHISIFDSPAVDPANDPEFDISKAPALSGWDYINERLEEWGSEDDPRYIARVLGQWAFDSGNTVYTAEDLAKAKNTVVLPYPDSVPEQGWDIARKGLDASVGYEKRLGEVWATDENGKPVEATGKEGIHIRRCGKWTKAPLVGNDLNNPSTAMRIHEKALAEGASIVKIDASGIGIGVVDGLVELEHGEYDIIEVFGGAASSDARAYRNMRAEQFFMMKTAMAKGLLDLDPSDEELFDELAGIQYENMDGGIIKIESKDAIRKAGRKSPDHADGLWYAFLDVSDDLEEKYPKGSKIPVDTSGISEEYAKSDRFYGGLTF